MRAEDAEAALARLVEEWRLADEAVAGLSFDDTCEAYGETFSLRMVYVHLCGEYARHNVHADLLRGASTGSPRADRPAQPRGASEPALLASPICRPRATSSSCFFSAFSMLRVSRG